MTVRWRYLDASASEAGWSEDFADREEAEGWLAPVMAQSRPGLPRPTWARELAENVIRLLSPLL